MKIADSRPFAQCSFSTLVAAFGALVATAPASADNINNCARYGADYVAVSGTNGCVKIGGHVRVDIARGPAVAPMGYAPVAEGVQRTAARTGGYYPPVAPFGLTDLFPR